MKLGYCARNDIDGRDKVLLQMTKKCRRSCRLCDFDADALEIGNRLSVYFISDEEYFDGTIIDTKMLHTVRQYLIKYDGYEDKPEWASSIALRRLGARHLTKSDEKSNKSVANKLTEAELSSTLDSSSGNSMLDSSDDMINDRSHRELSAAGSESSMTDESYKDEL